MNIFVLHHNPKEAAQMHCDKHLTKMIVETTQLLCFAHHMHNPNRKWIEQASLYAFNKSHGNHPCTKWVSKDRRNYCWTHRLLEELLIEYDYRYAGGKYEGPRRLVPILRKPPTGSYTKEDPDKFVLAMNARPECKGDYADESYRRFYIVGKREFAQWNKKRKAPKWYVQGCKEFDRLGDIQQVNVMI